MSNYIEHICDTAKRLLPDADFYYDDAIAVGEYGLDRNKINFIVGCKDKYLIKLGDMIKEYRLEQLQGRSVSLLRKVSEEK